MRKTGISHFLLLVSLTVIATSAFADMCWIDHVEKDKGGVKIYFYEPKVVSIKRH